IVHPHTTLALLQAKVRFADRRDATARCRKSIRKLIRPRTGFDRLDPKRRHVNLSSTAFCDLASIMSEQSRHSTVPIVPCNNIEASTGFYGRPGLSVRSDQGSYRILSH